MIELIRLYEEHGNIDTLLRRPRISMNVDECVWDFIYEKLVLPKKVLQSDKWTHQLVITMQQYDPDKHRFLNNNEYNPNYSDSIEHKHTRLQCRMDGTDRLFSPNKFFIVEGRIKASHIGIISPLVSEKITPAQYADLLYDGFGSFLTYNFNKIKKVELDELKNGLSLDVINGFPFEGLRAGGFDPMDYAVAKIIENGLQIETDGIVHYGHDETQGAYA